MAEQFNELGYEDSFTVKDIADIEDTVQYTLDNRIDYPIFNDTGIRIEKDKLLNYQDVKNILQQISIKNKTKFIEDINKSIILIDGKIIILRDEESINLDTISNQFNQINAVLLANKTRIGGW